MANRRESDSPVTDVDVLMRRVNALEQQVKLLQASGPSSLQTDGFTPATDAADGGQGEIFINHEGDHVAADASSPVVYKHLDQLYELASRQDRPTPYASVRTPTMGDIFLPDDVNSTTDLPSWDDVIGFVNGDIGGEPVVDFDVNNKPTIKFVGVYLVWVDLYIIDSAGPGTPVEFSYTLAPYFDTDGSGSYFYGAEPSTRWDDYSDREPSIIDDTFIIHSIFPVIITSSFSNYRPFQVRCFSESDGIPSSRSIGFQLTVMKLP